MKPSNEQLIEWAELYCSQWIIPTAVSESSIPAFVEDVMNWTTEKIAEEFDRKEQAGAKGYGPSVPAKLVRQFGSPSGPTLKQLSLLALNELVPAEDREKSSYKLLFTVISTLPESPTNTL